VAAIDQNGKVIVAGDSCDDQRLGVTGLTVGSNIEDLARFQFRATDKTIHRCRDVVDQT